MITEQQLAALEIAAECIMKCDGGDPRTDTGWKSDELLAAWLEMRKLTGEPNQ